MTPIHIGFLTRLVSRSYRGATRSSVFLSRTLHISPRVGPIIHVERADVYRYGNFQRTEAIFKELSWTVNPGESWVIVCNETATRGEIFQVQDILSLSYLPEPSLMYALRCS